MENHIEGSHDEVHRLAHVLVSLFEHWGVTAAEQEQILGVSERLELPNSIEDALSSPGGAERASLLLSIHARLRVLFPRNCDLAYAWMRTPNRAFLGQTPFSVACTQGVQGLKEIVNYLNQALYSL